MEERAHDALSQGELYNQGGNFTGQGGARSRTPDRRKQGTPKSLFWQSRIRVDFAGMGEEKLRSHFLVQRNGVNEGQATRETFNFEGDTNTLIRAATHLGRPCPKVEEAQPIAGFCGSLPLSRVERR